MKFSFSLKSLIKTFSRVKVVTKRSSLTHPVRDWWIVLISFVLAVALLLLWSAYLFWRIDTKQLFTKAENTTSFAQVFNRADLQKTLQEYQKRDLFYKNMLKAPPKLKNPR